MEHQQNQRKQLEHTLIEKAMKDEAFRKELLEDPRAAVEQVTGVKLPPEIQLKVLEEKPGQLYLVLPPAPVSETTDELTEEELTSVSGGTIGAETVETHWTYCNC